MSEIMEKARQLWLKYVDICEFAEIKYDPKHIIIGTIVGIFVGFFVGNIFDFTSGLLLAILAFDLGVGMPFYLADRKVAAIEERLPDVLHHIGTTLKTGGTIEVALNEVSRIDYGPITLGLKTMLREINEGKIFEDAFRDFAAQSRSELMKKAAIIIIAARKAGGGLLDTLTAMAEDIRALYRLKRERRTKTFMQFLFILVAGVLVAPFVFGIVKSVLQILVAVGGSNTPETIALVAQFDFLFKTYLILAAALTMASAYQVREGTMLKAVMYIPIGMMITYLIYLFIASSFLSLIGGGAVIR